MSRYVNTLATDNQPGCVSLGITGVFHILKKPVSLMFYSFFGLGLPVNR